MRVVDHEVFISPMHVFKARVSSANNYAHIVSRAFVDDVHQVILAIIKEDQR